MKFKFLCFVIIILLLPNVISYTVDEDNDEETHQYLTKESLKIWELIPEEFLGNSKKPIDDPLDHFGYDKDEDLITGSGEEDEELNMACARELQTALCTLNPALCPFITLAYVSTIARPFCYHFWDPDSPEEGEYDDGFLLYGSNYQKAVDTWNNKVIPLYLEGRKEESYYWLGRISHLIEDLTSVPHVQLDSHTGVLWNFIDSGSVYESYMSNEEIFTSYNADDLVGKQYNYENLPQMEDFDWSSVEPDNKLNKNFFRLLWYTAQKTQYWASDDVDGNSVYVDSDNVQHAFSPSLWSAEGVTPISSKSVFFDGNLQNTGNVDFYYSTYDTNKNCMLITSDYCKQAFGSQQDTCYYCNPNEGLIDGGNIGIEAEALMGHSMRAVAGLYRLFWDTVHSYDWPMYQHDLGRTGMTILRGSIADVDNRQYSYSFDPDFDDAPGVYFRDKPSIGDITGDGEMELVMTSSKIGLEIKSKVFAVNCKDTCNEKDVNLDYAWDKSYEADNYIYSNPVIVDLDGGDKDVLVATTKEIVRISNGKDIGSFEVTSKNYDNQPISPEINHLAVADVDYDGDKEIIISTREDYSFYNQNYTKKSNGKIRVYKYGNYKTLGGYVL